jgi:hypothetical protein
VTDDIGSAILETTAANFRQMLSRTRRELYGFLNRQCGLVNQSNPCRCGNKTSGFITSGWVQPGQLQFVDTRLIEVQRIAPDRTRELQATGTTARTNLSHTVDAGTSQTGLSVQQLLEETGINGKMQLGLDCKQ